MTPMKFQQLAKSNRKRQSKRDCNSCRCLQNTLDAIDDHQTASWLKAKCEALDGSQEFFITRPAAA